MTCLLQQCACAADAKKRAHGDPSSIADNMTYILFGNTSIPFLPSFSPKLEEQGTLYEGSMSTRLQMAAGS